MTPLTRNHHSTPFLLRCLFFFYLSKITKSIFYLDKGPDTVFWTDMTRHGCAGQFSSCFSNNMDDLERIYSTPYDGNCVGMTRLSSHVAYLKTTQCKRSLPMVCTGNVNVESSKMNSVKVRLILSKLISISSII
jgi:hypothetical protein